MDLKELEKLIKLFEASKITILELDENEKKIKLSKNKNDIIIGNNSQEATTISSDKVEANAIEDAPIAIDGTVVKSPLVGTYHEAPYKDANPFVKTGDKVKKGEKLCIIEAMKVMNEITAPCDGTIKKIYASDGEMVEYGKELFVIGD